MVGAIIWIVIVGFVAGIIARVLSPGPNNPSGFILTTVLGIAGAFLATWIGQAIGHHRTHQGSGEARRGAVEADAEELRRLDDVRKQPDQPRAAPPRPAGSGRIPQGVPVPRGVFVSVRERLAAVAFPAGGGTRVLLPPRPWPGLGAFPSPSEAAMVYSARCRLLRDAGGG